MAALVDSGDGQTAAGDARPPVRTCHPCVYVTRRILTGSALCDILIRRLIVLLIARTMNHLIMQFWLLSVCTV